MITIPFIENNAVTLVIVGIIYLIDLVVRLWLLFYIPKKRKPTAAMAWLLLIFILPIIGTLVFLIMGSTKLSRKRRQAQQVMTGLFDKQSRSLKKQNVTLHPTTDPIMRLAHSLTGMAATTGNTAIILHGYDNIIDVMIQAIDTAEEHVLVEFYALALDKTTEPFFAALERARERGVAVYVLFDAWGSHKFPRKKEMKQRLTQMQARWRQALPLRFRLSHYNRPDLRNHRKIVVIDNRDAYIGSLNMVDKHYHRRDTISYIELAVHLTGPAVLQLGAVVLSDWYAETGELTDYQLNQSAYRPTAGDTTIQVIPSGSDYQDQNNLKAFVSLIYGARKSITPTPISFPMNRYSMR